MAYFVMALLVWRGFRHLFTSPIIVVFLSIAFCCLFGWSDEWHQSFVEGRQSDLADWVADTVGALLAMSVLTSWQRCGVKKQKVNA